MNKTSAVAINFDRILIGLFYLFAFSLSFELVLEIFLSIETIFKPFRIVALLIIGTYFLKILKQGVYLNSSERHDVWLYGIFGYGFIISCVRIISGPFSMAHFYNDIFQAILLLLIFFIFKAVPMSLNHLHKCIRAYLWGVGCNVAYIFFNIVVLGLSGRRHSGFMDNPNYFALSLVVFICYLLLRLNYIQDKRKLLLMIIFLPILLFIFDYAGSRTGLIILILTSIFIYLFYSVKMKVLVLALIGLMSFLLYTAQYDSGFVSNSVLSNRIAIKMNKTEDVRFVIWKRIFKVMEEEGYFGMGIGQFKASFPKHFSEETNPSIVRMVDRSYYFSTHSDYMAILTDYGFPSLLCYLMYLFLTFTNGVKNVMQYHSSNTSEFMKRFTFLLFVSLLVFGLTAENFQSPLFWFILALATKSNVSAE